MTDYKLNKECSRCQHFLPFKMPQEIIDATINGKLVIFAGAGISTEGEMIMPGTLYQRIAFELNLKPTSPNLSFPELMTKFCRKFGRKKLIEEIFSRFNNIRSFPELYFMATKFHRELSKIPQIKEIFTTNWDTFFEDECGAMPIISSEEFRVFWDLPERKVFKIHGSVSNITTLVADKKDYVECYKKLKDELIGGYFKVLLSTRIFVFCGYSFKDEDLRKILDLLQKELGEFTPYFYLVTTDTGIDKSFLKKYNVHPIFTDATFFIHSLKKRLIRQKKIIAEENFERCCQKLHEIRRIHDKIIEENFALKYPISIYTLAYQDGLIHAFERMLTWNKTGEYCDFCRVQGLIHLYNNILSERTKERRFLEVSYVQGYLNGLLFLVVGKRGQKIMPLYYLYKEELSCDYEDYVRILDERLVLHKGSAEFANRFVSKNKIGQNDLVYHHPPHLL